MHRRRRGGKSIYQNAETKFERMARQHIDNRGRTFRMHFGIPRTIDTTETLHCLSLNLQRVKRKFWQHQDLKLEDIIIMYVYINQIKY